MIMQNLQIPETAESTTSSRIVPKWLFPPRLPDKDRITSSRPDSVLVTPIAAKTQKQQTNVGGWVFRSGREQLRETGSTSAAPPATNRATNPSRQHRPNHLNKHRRDIHLVKIKYCEDTRPQNQLNAAKEQHKDLYALSKEPPCVTLHIILLGVGGTIYNTHTLKPFKELGLDSQRVNKIASKLHVHSVTSLLNLSIPYVPFPVLLSTLIRSRFQVKPATLLIPIDFSFPFSRWRSFAVLGTKVAHFP